MCVIYDVHLQNNRCKILHVPKYHDVTIAANDSSAYTEGLRPHRILSKTAILLKISQINLKMICIQKKEK